MFSVMDEPFIKSQYSPIRIVAYPDRGIYSFEENVEIVGFVTKNSKPFKDVEVEIKIVSPSGHIFSKISRSSHRGEFKLTFPASTIFSKEKIPGKWIFYASTKHHRCNFWKSFVIIVEPKPELFLNVETPLLNISNAYFKKIETIYLGDIFIGNRVPINCIIQNAGTTDAFDIKVHVKYDTNFIKGKEFEFHIDKLSRGEIYIIDNSVVGVKTGGPAFIKFLLNYQGKICDKITLAIRSIKDPENVKIRKVEICKWPWNKQGVYCRRSDVDHISMLFVSQYAVGWDLVLRYRVPLTEFISGQYALDAEKVWNDVFKTFNNDPHFIDLIKKIKDAPINFQEVWDFWVKPRVDFTNRYFDYPYTGDKLKLDIGNHMYLHYGNIASRCSENNWRIVNGPTSHKYWWKTNKNVEEVQNLITNNKLINTVFGVTPVVSGQPAGYKTNDFNIFDKAGILYDHQIGRLKKRRSLFPAELYHLPNQTVIEFESYLYADPTFGLWDRFFDFFLRFISFTKNNRVKTLIRNLVLTRFFPILSKVKIFIDEAIDKNRVLGHNIHNHLSLAESEFSKKKWSENYEGAEEVCRYLTSKKGSVLWITTFAYAGKWWDAVNCPDHKIVDIKIIEDRKLLLSNNSDFELRNLTIRLKGPDLDSVIITDLKPGSKEISIQ